jgi:hypothetical protein
MDINVSSAYVAAQNAVTSFAALPVDLPKTFIYTGNRTNISPIPPLMASGMGKAAAANLMAYLSEVYAAKGYKYVRKIPIRVSYKVDTRSTNWEKRFHYADERDPDGSPVYSRIDGPGAGKFYFELAKHQTEAPWLATFVKGEGYKDFAEIKEKL